ncbi:MAG: hypothetical protein JWQ49_2615 [Edaphobacter sp.]|nr:hypothetical protein [Edaphobacter sp.]
MHRVLTTGLLLSAMTAFAQMQPPTVPETPAHLSDSASTELPDAPDPAQAAQENVVAVAEASFKATGGGARSCGVFSAMKVIYVDPSRYDVPKPCTELIYPYQRFLTSNIVIPMTWEQKGYLALHNLADPINFATILGISAITVGADSHSAYGPGLKGFGKSVGVSYLQDATGQFFGAFAIPVIAHQDPRYFRMPHAPFAKRVLYSISRTAVSRSDSGKSMPNYATLLNYPIGAELANLYVPGIHPDAASTVARIFTGYALDPVNGLINEFLPDVASHVHVRIIIVQRILNNVASGNSIPGS